MICIDLVYEWLWEFRHKATTAEYLLGLSTFGLIQVLGVEYGIAAGVVLYVACRQLEIDVGELKTVYVEEDENTTRSCEICAEPDETTKLVVNGDDSQPHF